MAFTWQAVKIKYDSAVSNAPQDVFRAKVPGGWIVCTHLESDVHTHALAFYPDPHHIWDGSTLS